VTRGQLPQRAGLPGLNGGGAATAVPQQTNNEDISLSSSFVLTHTLSLNCEYTAQKLLDPDF